MQPTKRSISLIIIVIFYITAGLNHFRDPNFYLSLIPSYIPYPNFIVTFSGLLEVIFGLGLAFQITRRYAAYAVVAMLIAFIPSHIYFIEIGCCIENGLCTPIWVGWVRLLVIHPILLIWAWYHRQ